MQGPCESSIQEQPQPDPSHTFSRQSGNQLLSVRIVYSHPPNVVGSSSASSRASPRKRLGWSRGAAAARQKRLARSNRLRLNLMNIAERSGVGEQRDGRETGPRGQPGPGPLNGNKACKGQRHSQSTGMCKYVHQDGPGPAWVLGGVMQHASPHDCPRGRPQGTGGHQNCLLLA